MRLVEAGPAAGVAARAEGNLNENLAEDAEAGGSVEGEPKEKVGAGTSADAATEAAGGDEVGATTGGANAEAAAGDAAVAATATRGLSVSAAIGVCGSTECVKAAPHAGAVSSVESSAQWRICAAKAM